MADKPITLEILTPHGPVAAAAGVEVDGVEAPGIRGEIGVRGQHVPLVTPVVPGLVRFAGPKGNQSLAVGSGFLEVSESGRVTLLVDRAHTADEVDRETVQARLQEVKAQLAEDRDSIDRDAHRHLEAEEGWLEAQIRLIAN